MASDGEAATGDLEALLQRGFRYAVALTHDDGDAEDLLHDALVSVLERGQEPKVGYLLVTIRNRFIDRIRRKRRAPTQPFDEADAPVTATPVEWDGPADREHLAAALAELRPEEREALYLTYVEGWTTREIAEHCRRPRGTVLSLLHRGRQKLRERLETDGKEVRR